MSKKTFSFDIGTASIGWSVINKAKKEILGIGSRIIKFNGDENSSFIKGTGQTANQKRSNFRSNRKTNQRYKIRRIRLNKELKKYNMLSDKLTNISERELYRLRSISITEQISLEEIGRLFRLLNQKRGYKSLSNDDIFENDENDDSEYLDKIKNLYQTIKDKNQTIGQYFYSIILNNKYYRLKEQVFPREAYIEEFNSIYENQQQYYPDTLTEELKVKLRDKIIYFQRPLKSAKHLVTKCTHEGSFYKNIDKNGEKRNDNLIFGGPRVSPRTSPLVQLCKIWESINNLKVQSKSGGILDISKYKRDIFEYLDNNEKLTEDKLFQILSIKKSDGYYTNKNVEKKGIQGNITKCKIREALEGFQNINDIIRFDIEMVDIPYLDENTGELITHKEISTNCMKEPLYDMWHKCYSIKNKVEKIKVLNKILPLEYAEKLSNVCFKHNDFSNKSLKLIRRILPSMMDGYMYSDAMNLIGYNHSNSLTKEENNNRKLETTLKLISKGELRQPIVEKILNQLINLTNALIEKYGSPDEIVIELARELRQNKEERNEYFKYINAETDKRNEISKKLESIGVTPSSKNIDKYKLYHETDGICLYCNKKMDYNKIFNTDDYNIEHIIPKSVLHDDSFTNKTLTHRKCNSSKNNDTAFDYMSSKSNSELNTYLYNIFSLYNNKNISKSKYNRLKWRRTDIPADFISRQLQETRYITVKAKEILNKVCSNVRVTSGQITSYLREIWGWNKILKDINPSNINKRDDHRHHAIDALIIACTTQSIVQRLNSPNGTKSLTNFAEEQNIFDYEYVKSEISKILISYKPSKKITTNSRRKYKGSVVQENILTPRGGLHEESIYSIIKHKRKCLLGVSDDLDYIVDNSDKILSDNIRKLLNKRLEDTKNDIKKFKSSLKKEPIFIGSTELKYIWCYENRVVIKKKIGIGAGYIFSGKKDETREQVIKKIERIVDDGIRKKLSVFLGINSQYIAPKDAFKTQFLNSDGKPILSVRCFIDTNYDTLIPLRTDENGNHIHYVESGDNHHLAFYLDNGKYVEHIVRFKDAVDRERYLSDIHDISIIENGVIKNPEFVNNIIEFNDNIPLHFKKSLPNSNYTFVESIHKNDMFVMNMTSEELDKCILSNDMNTISKNLYRCIGISNCDYKFFPHTKTQINVADVVRIRSAKKYQEKMPIKVYIDNIGNVRRTSSVISNIKEVIEV